MTPDLSFLQQLTRGIPTDPMPPLPATRDPTVPHAP
ncbi:hypothetical protein KIPB_005858, partial [Kipferlia bialata]|eukprot:g5858.t1